MANDLAGETLSGEALAAAQRFFKLFAPSESAVAKLLQTQSGFAILVRIGGKLVSWSGPLALHLQHLEKKTVPGHSCKRCVWRPCHRDVLRAASS